MKGTWTFFHGYLVASCIASLSQDLMGKDKFLEWAGAHWVDGAVTIPLALFVLVAVYLDGKFRRKP